MRRLCALRIAIWCLVLVIAFDGAVTLTLGASLCATDGASTCADLGNISAPFAPACAGSNNSFGVSNCSSAHASWDAFQSAVKFDDDYDGVRSPELLGIRKLGYVSYINLTWTPNEASTNHCSAPFPSANVTNLLPDVINLTSFANGDLRFSPWSYFLLFGCSKDIVNASGVANETSACSFYKNVCQANLSCVQKTPFQELALASILKQYSCSAFAFLAAGNTSAPPSQWRSAAIQLTYVSPACRACVDNDGPCSAECTCEALNVCACNGLKCNKALIGIIVSVVAMAIVVCLAGAWWMQWRSRRYSTRSFVTKSSNRIVTQRAYLLSKKFGPTNAMEFTFESLCKATDCFSEANRIGDGGFGAVYFGNLKGGCSVAIKRLYHDNFKRMDHFYNEIQLLSACNHPNLVKLHGFCCQDMNDLLLVFEYAASGTVSDQIHDIQKPPMPWKTRLSIMRETAEALSYLHNSLKPPIYHRDVKTTNILLDENLHVKLGDFGLSRLVPIEATHVSTAPQGTAGYLDPDYHHSYQLTDKSDVYSFGVVLVELVSAKMAVDMSRDKKEINLSSLALMKIGSGMWQELVDPRLEIAKNPEVEMMVKRVLELSFMCLHPEKDSRPTMENVAGSLSNLWQEIGYNDEHVNGTSPTSSMDDTKHLMRDRPTTKSTKSSRGSSLVRTSSDWSSSYNSWSSGP